MRMRKSLQGLMYSNNLKNTLAKLNMTQHDLAEKTGIPEPTISRIVGNVREPTIEQLMLISKELGVGVDHLLELDNDDLESMDFATLETALQKAAPKLSRERKLDLIACLL